MLSSKVPSWHQIDDVWMEMVLPIQIGHVTQFPYIYFIEILITVEKICT